MSDTEDSRAASLGRKRPQHPDAVQTAHDAEKRRKLESNAVFVALDSDDNSEWVSGERESGEVSSGESDSDAEANDPEHAHPHTRGSSSKSTSREHSDTPARPQRPNANANNSRIPVDAVFPPSLQGYVRQQLELRNDLTSVEAVLKDCNAPGKHFRKAGQDFLTKWKTGYQKHLGDFDYLDLKRLIQDRSAFRQPMQIQPSGKSKGNGPNGKDGSVDFGARVLASCEKNPSSSCAEMVWSCLADLKLHEPASEALQKYLAENLLPASDPRSARNETAGIDETDKVLTDSRTDNANSPSASNKSANGPDVIEIEDSDDESLNLRKNVHLSELSKDELRDQALYANLHNADDLVRCLSCGDRGHMKYSCPASRCAHCRSKTHFSRTCPSNQKCTRCRQRGHRSDVCARGSKLAGAIGDECDVCGERGHAEEECSGIWMTFRPTPENIKLIPEDQMVVSCYNCGRSTHWGDDCPGLPDFVGDFITFDTWSAKNARRYIAGRESDSEVDDDAASVGQEKDMNGSMQTHQLAQLGDWA